MNADRFVPTRVGIDPQNARSKIFSESKCREDEDDVLKQDPYAWRKRSYVRLLGSTLQKTSSESPILKLFESNPGGRKSVPRRANTARGWPCAPRRKPVLGQPDVIFDMPEYQSNMHNDILDWGKSDILAAGLGSEIFIWYARSNEVFTVHSFGDDVISATKWDPRGIYIGIGTLMGNLYVYDSVSEKMMPISRQRYRSELDVHPSITAIAWSGDGLQLACCTGTGTISLCELSSKTPSVVREGAHAGDILAVSYSPDGRYLVSTGMDCMVRLWRLPEVAPFFEIVYANPARALAWHPWKRCQLAIGGGAGGGRGLGDGSLSLWDVALQTNLCHRLPSASCAIDALAWNVLTAELVVSYWINESAFDRGYCKLLVLSGPTKATDELCAPPGRTRALLFNSDGTRIATASANENMFIWNFLGKPGPLFDMYERKIRMSRLYRKIEQINEYNNFGIVIR